MSDGSDSQVAGDRVCLQGSQRDGGAAGATGRPTTGTVREKDICGYCIQKCTHRGRGSDGICCDYCGFWVHATCDGMTQESYKMFNKLAKDIPNMSYYCSLNHCKTVAGEILKQLGPIRQRVEENSQRIGVLEERVGKQSEEMENKIEDKITNIVADTIEEQVKRVWETERDRASRVNNVLLANVPESTAVQGQQRKMKDTEFVSDLFGSVMRLDSENVVSKILSVMRLGKRDESGNRPRLLKVVLDQESTAYKVLRAAPELTKSEDENVKEIRVFRDLSKGDRDQRKSLVDEMKQKNEELKNQVVGDSKWIIRGDKVVKIKVNPNRFF